MTRFLRLGVPIFCGGDRGRYVALTFDDGPGPFSALTLRILRRAQARATFFLVGRNLAEWPSLPRRELRLGALGDHTWTHAWLPGLTRAQVRWQLARTEAAIAAASRAPVRLFRPPYGAHDPAIDRQAHRLGMLEVLWSIDTRDSEGVPWYKIAATVVRDLRPGSIVLMHENHGQTIRALKFEILPMLRRRDYRAVTIPQLLALDPPIFRRGVERCGPTNTHRRRRHRRERPHHRDGLRPRPDEARAHHDRVTRDAVYGAFAFRTASRVAFRDLGRDHAQPRQRHHHRTVAVA